MAGVIAKRMFHPGNHNAAVQEKNAIVTDFKYCCPTNLVHLVTCGKATLATLATLVTLATLRPQTLGCTAQVMR